VVAGNSLVLPAALRDQLVREAELANPSEACGMLAGHQMTVERVFPVRNSAEEIEAERAVFRDRATGVPSAGRAAVHYYMDPRDQLRVYNELDALELDLVGYYHSHTHTEARPSATDIRLATDLQAVYLLVGLEDPARPSVRAWRIAKADPADETGELVELGIVASR
jgi:[CysO sulfur-carrier protein]-S-L-cysteine hydrolase